MKEILVLQHIDCEPLGTIGEVLNKQSLPFRYLRSASEKIPADLTNTSGLIIMGGPMGVYEQDRYPFLRDEIRLIEKALGLGMPVLGICLGSQLLAATLGAPVTKGRKKEIGWHTVRLKDAAKSDLLFSGVPESFQGFHWHGDIFKLPPGSTALASSDLTEIQAFRYGKNAYGILFHMEVTAAIIQDWVREFSNETREEKIETRLILEGMQTSLEVLNRVGEGVFSKWAGLTKV